MLKHELYREPSRPQFHLTARYWDDYRVNPQKGREGWLNDVNGLVFLDGEYHFFAQRWARCWVHAVSSDLIHWEELQPAFGRDAKFGGTQSGGAVIDRHNTSGLAAGETPVMVAFWSSTDNLRQCISYSNDRGRTWVKYDKNPVLVYPERDPKVFWYEPEKKWVMILYGTPGRSYNLFSSLNLLDWVKMGEAIPDMFECPDMFPLSEDGGSGKEKWVIVDGEGSYVIGGFDGTSFVAETKKVTGDYGRNFYATMTWNDMPQEDPRRIQVAWMRGGEYPDMPFSQQISFACELKLRTLPSGIRLCRYPIREIERIHADTFVLRDVTLNPGMNPLKDIHGELFDICVEIDTDRSSGGVVVFQVRDNTVSYDLNNNVLESCGSQAELEPDAGTIYIRILVDRMSVETFGNMGEVSITNCVQFSYADPPVSLMSLSGSIFIKSVSVRQLCSIW